MKTGYVIGGLVLVLMGLMIWVFSNKTITDKCSDMLMTCVQNEATKTGWGKVSGGFGCMIDNITCVLSRIPEGF